MTSSRPSCVSTSLLHEQRMTSLRFPVDDAHAQSTVPLLFPLRQDAMYCGGDGQGQVVMLVAVAASRSAVQPATEEEISATCSAHGVDLTLAGSRSLMSDCVVQDLTTLSTRCSDSKLHTNMSGRCERLSTMQLDVSRSSVVKSSTFSTRNPGFKSPKSYWLRRHSDSVLAMESGLTDVDDVTAAPADVIVERTCSHSSSTVDDLDAAGLAADCDAGLPGRDSDEVFDEPAVESTQSAEDTELTGTYWASEGQSVRAVRRRLNVVSAGDLEDIREEEIGRPVFLSDRELSIRDVASHSSPSLKPEVSEQLVPDDVDVNSTKPHWLYAPDDGDDDETRKLMNGDKDLARDGGLARPEVPCSLIHRRAARVARSSRSSTSDESTSGSMETSGNCKVHHCSVCRRTFSRSDMLERHARLHTGLRPYACRLCPQVFSRSDHLTTHLRTHTGEKPYSCPRCAYTASRRDMVTRHLRVHQSTADRAAGAGSEVVGPPRQRTYRSRYRDRPTKPGTRRPAAGASTHTSSPPRLPPLLLDDYLQPVDNGRVPAPPLSPPLSPAAGDPAVWPRRHASQSLHALPPRSVVARGSTGSTDSYSSPGCLSACDIFEFAAVGSDSPEVFRSPASARQSTVFLFPYTDTPGPAD